MPNAVVWMNEYAPKRSRSTLVAIMFSGYSLGTVLCAGLGIYMLPRYGLQSMFYIGVLPLLLPLILWKLPESVGCLLRNGQETKGREMLAKVAPDYQIPAGVKFVQADA